MSANAVTETGRGGRFRIAVPDAGSCLLDVLQRGFQRARLLFDVCPDTMLRVILRRATARTPSFEDLRDRCGTRATQPCSDPQNIRFIAISSGQSHACGIAADSSAWCWGDGRNGQLGVSRREVSRFPQRVPGDQRFVSMAAGGKFTCSRTAHGEVVCWGDERTVPGWPQQAAGPVLVRLPEPATSLTAGRRHLRPRHVQQAPLLWRHHLGQVWRPLELDCLARAPPFVQQNSVPPRISGNRKSDY